MQSCPLKNQEFLAPFLMKMYDEDIKYKEVSDLTEEEMRKYEGDIISALVETASYKDDEKETRKIKITRNGVLMFTFCVRPSIDGRS